MAVPTVSLAMQPKIENESATYSQDGIVISADVLRKSQPVAPQSPPQIKAIEVVPEAPTETVTEMAAPSSATNTRNRRSANACYHSQPVYLSR